MDESDLICKIAFSFLKKATPDMARGMIEKGIAPRDFFRMKPEEAAGILSLRHSDCFSEGEMEAALRRAAEEARLTKRHNIRVYGIFDSDYPVRLLQIPDAPLAIYQLGDTDLDGRHMLSLVGTRRPTAYGADFCSKIISDLAAYFPDLTVVSGLAYGIDAAAHNGALSAGIPTAGVVAHGLNMIYPAAHRDLARQIIQHGGCLVSEYPFGEQPFRQRFLERNRIIAALCDVTIVAESDLKGGAMSTANTAFSYSREVMALPGRISDQQSAGCNLLIRKEKARMVTSAADVIEATGWKPLDLHIDATQRNLFPELEGDPKLIYEALRFSRDAMMPDELHLQTLIPMARLMSALGEMEFDGLVTRHPGNRYSLL